jgi:cation:H+ antiporter
VPDWIAYPQVVAGLLVLLFGGEALVRGAVTIARRLSLSPLVIGLTVVAFGTSLPELVVSLDAVLRGVPGIAVGNVIGSNIANILLILGIAALLYPIRCNPESLLRDGGFLLGATVLFCLFAFDGHIGRLEGIVLLAGILFFIVFSYYSERRGGSVSGEVHVREGEMVADIPAGPRSTLYSLLFIGGGIIGLHFGADLLVGGAVTIAHQFGVSDAIIGLTLVAVGTSLPELAATGVAAWRRESDVALGNVIGSNIFNILGVLGTTSVLVGLPVDQQFLRADLWIMLGITVLFIPMMVTGWRLTRREGSLLLGLYVCYIAAVALGLLDTDVPSALAG